VKQLEGFGIPLEKRRFPRIILAVTSKEAAMPLKKIHRLFLGSIPRLAPEEAEKIFKRDRYTCQYCGLDGLSSFENWMVMTIDHIHAYARGGSTKAENQVTACQPCNTIKGTRDFKTLADAKKFVQAKRAEWLAVYKEQSESAGQARPTHVKAAGA
jgi:hypothetical protein